MHVSLSDRNTHASDGPDPTELERQRDLAYAEDAARLTHHLRGFVDAWRPSAALRIVARVVAEHEDRI